MSLLTKIPFAIMPICHLKVTGHSMEPTFREGELVLVNRWAYLFLQPKVGDAVIAIDPFKRHRLILKRIKWVVGDLFLVDGDNSGHTTERLVNKFSILGKVMSTKFLIFS